ncbi:MAG: hypothetical protein ACPGYX_03760 [Oceanobacter sp.]
MTIKPIWRALATTFMLTLALAGCGSSGDSDSDSNTSDNNTTNNSEQVDRVSLTGLAIKGIFINGLVTLSSLDGTEIYGSDLTDENGQYSLADMDIPSGPILATLTTIEETAQLCDSAIGCEADSGSIAFGDYYTFHDEDFFLIAVLPGYEDGVTDESLMITAMTHLAGYRALQEGVTDSEAIESINSATAELFGLAGADITRLAPSNLGSYGMSTDSALAQEYGAINAAFATLAATRGMTLTETLEQVSANYAYNGGLIANSSSEGIIDLHDIYSASIESLEAAVLAGVEVDDQALLALENERLDASAETEDVFIEAKTEDVVVADITTQTAATQAAVDLLLSLNDWYDALFGEAAQEITSGYEDEIDSVIDLLPLLDEQAESIRGLRELIVSGSVDSACCDDQEEGSLLKGTAVTAQLADLAAWIYANQSSLDETTDSEGYRTASVVDLIYQGADIAILGFLRTASTGNEITGDLSLRYQTNIDSGYIELLATGTGAEASITAGSVTMTAGDNTMLTFDIQGLEMTGSQEETFSGTGQLIVTFASDTDKSTYLQTHNEASDLNISAISLQLDSTIQGIPTDSDDGNFARATAVLDIDMSTARSDGDSLTTDLTANLNQSHPTSDSDPADMALGTLTMTLQHRLAEQSSLEEFLLGGDWSSAELDFVGELVATTEAGDSVEFNGELLVDSTIENDQAQNLSFELDGALVFTQEEVKTGFAGVLSLSSQRLRDANGEDVYKDGDPWYMISAVDMSGYLSLGDSDTTSASLAVSAVLRQTDLDTLVSQITFTDMPEVASMLAEVTYSGYEITTDTSNNSALLSYQHNVTSGFRQALADELSEAGLLNIELTTDLGFISSLGMSLSNCSVIEENGASTENSICDLSLILTAINGVQSAVSETYTLPTENAQNPDVWSESLLEQLVEALPLKSSSSIQLEALQGEASAYASDERNLNEFGSASSPISISIPVISSYTKDSETIVDELESDSLYRGMGASLTVDFNSIDFEDASIQTLVTRDGLDDAAVTVRLSYGNQMIQLQADTAQDWTDIDTNSIEISDGTASMLISATCAHSDGDFSGADLYDCDGDLDVAGEIFVGDFQIGTLESRDDLPVFVFEDGDDYQILITPAFLVEAVQ